MQPDLIARIPLRCRWGLHKWGKWSEVQFAAGLPYQIRWQYQSRTCRGCNKHQDRTV